MAKNMAQELTAVSEYEKQKLEIEREYKKKLQALKDRRSETVKKVDVARTHVVMETTPYIMKALGLSEILNITAEDITADPVMKERVESSKNYNIVFDDYRIAAKAVGDFFYNNPDMVELIMEFVNKELVVHGKQEIRKQSTEQSDE